MPDESGPRRLRQGSDTPQALLRAIDALRKGVDDSARLSRVGQKLEGVLNAPPTAASVETTAAAAQRTGLFGQKLGTLKLMLGGLAVLVALAPLYLLRHSDDGAVPGTKRDGSSSDAAPSVEAAPLAAAAQEARAADEAPQATEAAAPDFAQPQTQATRHGIKHATHLRERAGTREAAASAEPATPVPAAKQSSARAETAEPTAAREPTSASERSERPKNSLQSAEKPKPAEEAPVVPAEADLLLKARKALKLDPNLALSLAAEHQSYYPKGRLVPEREVLAIEALRNLGRKQEADERLRKFEARYPKSIHLQRLHDSN